VLNDSYNWLLNVYTKMAVKGAHERIEGGWWAV